MAVLLVAAVIGVLGLRPWETPPSTTSRAGSGPETAAGPAPDSRWRHAPPDRRDGALGEADGVVTGAVTVFDDVPAVTRLHPGLRRALRRAAEDAAGDGITFHVNSGWRSRAYQNQLLRDAVSTYGSEAEAARWVATADTSAHVSGEAADIGPSDAATWLSRNGAAYGLCQIYRNEPWHYERRPGAADQGCPSQYADPTQDPRMAL